MRILLAILCLQLQGCIATTVFCDADAKDAKVERISMQCDGRAWRPDLVEN